MAANSSAFPIAFLRRVFYCLIYRLNTYHLQNLLKGDIFSLQETKEVEMEADDDVPDNAAEDAQSPLDKEESFKKFIQEQKSKLNGEDNKSTLPEYHKIYILNN